MIQEQEIDQEDSFKVEPEANVEDLEAIQSLLTHRSSKDQFSVLLETAFEEMEGTTREKVKRLLNRLQKFFLRDSRNRINIKKEFFCPRREPI